MKGSMDRVQRGGPWTESTGVVHGPGVHVLYTSMQMSRFCRVTLNRPFPNYLWPLFQSESWCSSFHMKISFHSHANENKFSYEKMSTKTRFEKEAKGYSEMAYCFL